jgi:phosphoribosyl-dephospho-CoA transferase
VIEKLKNKIKFFSEFSRLKKAIPKEWYVHLSEEKSVKTTINIKKENIIPAGRVIDMDKLVNKNNLGENILCRKFLPKY